MMNALPYSKEPIETTKLPTGYKPLMIDDGEPKKSSLYKSNLDKGFTSDEIKRLMDYNAAPPSQY